jgi:hypothetical protein
MLATSPLALLTIRKYYATIKTDVKRNLLRLLATYIMRAYEKRQGGSI